MSLYSDPGLQWAATSFVQPQVENRQIPIRRSIFPRTFSHQVMIHEKFLYDRKTGEWTPEKYLEDLNSRFIPDKDMTWFFRYGGIDSVLLWQGYPNLGFDDRNQFQLLESLPGGLEGLKGFISKVVNPSIFWLPVASCRCEGTASLSALGRPVTQWSTGLCHSD